MNGPVKFVFCAFLLQKIVWAKDSLSLEQYDRSCPSSSSHCLCPSRLSPVHTLSITIPYHTYYYIVHTLSITQTCSAIPHHNATFNTAIPHHNTTVPCPSHKLALQYRTTMPQYPNTAIPHRTIVPQYRHIAPLHNTTILQYCTAPQYHNTEQQTFFSIQHKPLLHNSSPYLVQNQTYLII